MQMGRMDTFFVVVGCLHRHRFPLNLMLGPCAHALVFWAYSDGLIPYPPVRLRKGVSPLVASLTTLFTKSSSTYRFVSLPGGEGESMIFLFTGLSPYLAVFSIDGLGCLDGIVLSVLELEDTIHLACLL